jgi:hypothetical protein
LTATPENRGLSSLLSADERNLKVKFKEVAWEPAPSPPSARHLPYHGTHVSFDLGVCDPLLAFVRVRGRELRALRRGLCAV